MRRANASASELARETGVPADVIIPVPDSGVPAAMGYAAESGLPFELGIIRNHYVGRTFHRADRPDPALGRASSSTMPIARRSPASAWC